MNLPNATRYIARRRLGRSRTGITILELTVSAVILVAVMTFFTTLSVRINQVWKDIGYKRMAMAELANQVDQISRLDRVGAEKAIESLSPSTLCEQTLSQPELTGEINQTELGTQIVLRLNWKRSNGGKPVELVGWLVEEGSP